MYFLPEEETDSHHVSKKLNQNIKLMREFSTVKSEDWEGYGSFMKFRSKLILFSEGDVKLDVSMKSCIIDNNGYSHFFESPRAPPNTLQVTFDSLPIVAFYTLSFDDEIVHFSLKKIPGILSEYIQVNDPFTKSCFFKDIDGVFSTSNFVGLTSNGFYYHSQEKNAGSDRNEINDHKNNENGNYYRVLILFELQLKEPDQYQLAEISHSNLELLTGEIFRPQMMIFNKVEGIMLIQLRTFDEVILLLYNIDSRNIEGTITILEDTHRSKYTEVLAKVFFVNHTDFQGGIIALMSHIDKKIKVFTRCGKIGYR